MSAAIGYAVVMGFSKAFTSMCGYAFKTAVWMFTEETRGAGARGGREKDTRRKSFLSTTHTHARAHTHTHTYTHTLIYTSRVLVAYKYLQFTLVCEKVLVYIHITCTIRVLARWRPTSVHWDMSWRTLALIVWSMKSARPLALFARGLDNLSDLLCVSSVYF